MTRYINSDYHQYCPAAAATTLHSGAGKVLALFFTSTSTTPASITVYDNTAASGNILLVFSLAAPQPLAFILPYDYPLVFSSGLTVVTPAGVSGFVITEA